jgi:hypothetical protein
MSADNVFPERRTFIEGEVLNLDLDMTGYLNSGELITGTPTVTEVTTTDLTISNKAVNTAALTINHVEVAIGKAIQCTVVGQKAATAEYCLLVGYTSDASPTAAQRKIRLYFDVIA